MNNLRALSFISIVVAAVLSPRTQGAIVADANCGVTIGCFPDCQPNCNYLVTWTIGNAASNTFTVSKVISGTDNRYVGVGFSADKSMGDDSVTLCMLSSSLVSVKQSWNPGYDNNILADSSTGLTQTNGSFENGILTCTFTRAKSISAQSEFRNLSNPAYMFVAEGSIQSASKIEHHDNTPVISSSQLDFSSVTGSGTSQASNKVTLFKAHGCIMSVAWIALSTIGIMIAMWYKPVWPNTKIKGIHVWFISHRVLMVLTFLLTVTAFIIIYTAKDWEMSDITIGEDVMRYHPIFGLITTILVLINPILPVFRCSPTDSKRWIFNLCHGFIGFSANIFGVVALVGGATLAETMNLTTGKLTTVSYVFIAWCCAVAVLLSILSFAANQKNKSTGSMELAGTDESTPAMFRGSSSSTIHTVKKGILVLHILVAIACAIAFIVMLNE